MGFRRPFEMVGKDIILKGTRAYSAHALHANALKFH